MNAKQIQNGLFNHFGGSSMLMVPNYSPAGWFESDIYRVTKAGYAEEIEVKISVADFRIDALKGPTERDIQYWESFSADKRPDARKKHERLAAGDPKGPRRFSFILPQEIAGKVTIPEWAGLYVARQWGKSSLIRVVKAPPALHALKADPKVIEHAKSVFYFRYWNLRRSQPEEGAA